MSEPSKPEPSKPEPSKTTVQQAREQRLRQALRENLKRRKAQIRGRERPDAAEKMEKTKRQLSGDSGC